MKGKPVLLNVLILVLLLLLATANAANAEIKMYWADAGTTNKIQRANLDGTGVEDVVIGLDSPQGIALDIVGGKMYWTEAGTTQKFKIKRASLDGTSMENLVVVYIEAPRGIALDIASGKMYWTEAGTTNKIRRANLDGTGVEDVITGLDGPQGIALDIVGGKMYWIDAGTTNKIQRANLDSTGVEDVITGLDSPSAITLAQETEAFTYQGRLIDANSAANGFYDFQFKLFDDPCDGNQLGDYAYKLDVDVVDGYFTVELVFDARIFTGQGLWLEIDVRPSDRTNSYTTLSPRQEVTHVPYALHAKHTRGMFVGNYNTFLGREAGYSNTTGQATPS